MEVLKLKLLFCSRYFLCRTDTIETWKFNFFGKPCITISKIDASSQFFLFFRICILSKKWNKLKFHSFTSVPEIWVDRHLVFLCRTDIENFIHFEKILWILPLFFHIYRTKSTKKCDREYWYRYKVQIYNLSFLSTFS